MARLSSRGCHGQRGHATTGEQGVILIFLTALSALSAASHPALGGTEPLPLCSAKNSSSGADGGERLTNEHPEKAHEATAPNTFFHRKLDIEAGNAQYHRSLSERGSNVGAT